MIKSIFLTSVRALLNQKQSLLLNIIGLSIGIAACLLAYNHITHQLSFDRYYDQQDQLYRLVVGNMETGEGWVKVSAPIPAKLANEIPEIKQVARATEYSYNEKDAIEVGDQIFTEPSVMLADLELFDMLGITMHSGSIPQTIAGDEIFISTTIAQKLFKNQEVINQTLRINGKHTYRVVGIFESIPENSHFEAEYIVPFSQLETVLPGTSLTGNWGQFNYFSYLLLDENADPQAVRLKIKSSIVEFGNGQEMKFEQLELQPIADIHFQESPGNLKSSYDRKYLFIYASIALAIFLVSVINFLNLSIATSTRRIKEVGLRKIMGAPQSNITMQFMAEGLLLSSLAVILAIILASAGSPWINELVNSSGTSQWLDPYVPFVLIGLILFVTIFSGLYVSFFVASFKPIHALKGGIKLGQKDSHFKNGLLVAQFVMSSLLILSSIFIYQQLHFIRNTNLGMNKDHLISIKLYDTSSQDKINTLTQEFKQIPGVRATALSRFTPGTSNWNQTVTWAGQKEELAWNIIEAGPNFLEVYGLELMDGQAETIHNVRDSKIAYLVNEEAVRQGQWSQPVGQVIAAMGSRSSAPIAGVVKNFHFRSLHNSIDPLVIIVREHPNNNVLTVQFDQTDPQRLLSNLEATYQQVMAGSPFEYHFVGQQFEQLYQVESQTAQLIGLLSGVAILLSILGTYALMSFTLKERSKEIAIRKVLGSQLTAMIMLLGKRYLFLLGIANIIGSGLTIYLINRWLENFSYHITPGILPTALGILTSFVTILLVILPKALQAEKINPAEALKDD